MKEKNLPNFVQPTVSLLKMYEIDKQVVEVDEGEIIANKNLIEKTLANLKIGVERISAIVGPNITLYKIVPSVETKISRIQSLAKNVVMGFSEPGIRIVPPILGSSSFGIEIPNRKRQVVSMYSVLNSKAFKESTMELPVALGKTITNEVFMFDLAKMPHLLIGGALAQGKTVAINAIITSLLYKKHPSQLKFVLMDPKMVEYNLYEGLKKHYLAQCPGNEDIIVSDCEKAIQTLNSLVLEMENRYRILNKSQCRNIVEYNKKFQCGGFEANKGYKYLPYIVVVIDEYGDFIMQAGEKIETPIARIAQKARAVGMHLILATQRPSVKIITSIIKANVPGRIALKSSSRKDSCAILDCSGAEKLAWRGDLLISKNEEQPERHQCAFVDTPEIERIVDYIERQQGYFEPMQLPENQEDKMEVAKLEQSLVLSVNSDVHLNDLIGLNSVKQQVNSLYNYLKIKQIRKQKGLKVPIISQHLIFTGNPGTGKTTVARIIAKIYKDLGILKKGHLIETDRSGLVANYVGQTATKTNKLIDSALDGVLFIDEAYMLSRDSGNDYGMEAIATLLKRMEDDRHRLVVILAGYPKEMNDFLESNPGLRSRFNNHLFFPDYSVLELMEIFEFQCKRNDYTISEDAKKKLQTCIQQYYAQKDKTFGNARFVRNLFEETMHTQANRLVNMKKCKYKDLSMIEACDIVISKQRKSRNIFSSLLSLVGLLLVGEIH